MALSVSTKQVAEIGPIFITYQSTNLLGIVFISSAVGGDLTISQQFLFYMWSVFAFLSVEASLTKYGSYKLFCSSLTGSNPISTMRSR